jgi:hypothetical protein
LRASFLASGIDTIYFLAEENWIDGTTLPGYVVMPGTPALFDHLEKRLKSAGHADWAQFLAGFSPVGDKPGWMSQKPVDASEPSAKAALVEHALKTNFPIRSASVSTRSLPALQVNLNNAIPLSVVTLEKGTLDRVLGQILTALVPSCERTTRLLGEAECITVSALVHPFPMICQVAHLPSAQKAQILASEIALSIKTAVKKVVDSDADAGTLAALFAQSMMLVSAQGKDVVLVMKPPLLFDLDMAQRKAQEVQDQDWSALPPPVGYHWDLVAVLGASSRNDVVGGTASVRVRSAGAAPTKPSKTEDGRISFRIPHKEITLKLTCDARGNLTIDPPDKGAKLPALPALELLDDRDAVIALLRLDVAPGDPRYDLVRTKAILQARRAERAEFEKQITKDLGDLENEQKRQELEQKSTENPSHSPRRKNTRSGRNTADKAGETKNDLGLEHATLFLLQNVQQKAVAFQRRFPATTLVKDGDDSTDRSNASAGKHQQFRFAGEWLFYCGMLTLHQDAQGVVAGTFTSHRQLALGGKSPYLVRKQSAKVAVVSGQVAGATLTFSLIDTRGNERKGKLVLDVDGLGGTWSLEASEDRRRGSSIRIHEPAVQGRLDRLDIGIPETAWFQEVGTGSFAGYWVHATNKDNNAIIKPLGPGRFEIVGGPFTRPPRNINNKTAAAGNLLFVAQQTSSVSGPQVHEAILSADGQNLTLDPDVESPPTRRPTTGGLSKTTSKSAQKGIKLMRQSKE